MFSFPSQNPLASPSAKKKFAGKMAEFHVYLISALVLSCCLQILAGYEKLTLLYCYSISCFAFERFLCSVCGFSGGIFTRFWASLETRAKTKSNELTESWRWNGIQIKIKTIPKRKRDFRIWVRHMRFVIKMFSNIELLFLSVSLPDLFATTKAVE